MGSGFRRASKAMPSGHANYKSAVKEAPPRGVDVMDDSRSPYDRADFAAEDDEKVEHFELSDLAADAPPQTAYPVPNAEPADMEAAGEQLNDPGQMPGDASGLPLPPGGGGMGGMGGAGGGEAGRPAPATKTRKTPQSTTWALEGLRSLTIDLQAELTPTSFRSLGAEPRLDVTLVDQRRLDLLGWVVALAILLRGILLTNHPLVRRLRYVVVTLLVAYAVPLALPYSGLTNPVCNMAFYAACWLIVYYLLAAIAQRLIRVFRRLGGRPARLASTTTLACLLMMAATSARADDPQPPLSVPRDAIIIPYDPEQFDPLAALKADPDAAQPGALKLPGGKEQKIYVPYDKYLEMLRACRRGTRIGPTRRRPTCYWADSFKPSSMAGNRWP